MHVHGLVVIMFRRYYVPREVFVASRYCVCGRGRCESLLCVHGLVLCSSIKAGRYLCPWTCSFVKANRYCVSKDLFCVRGLVLL